MRCYFLRGGQIAGVNMLPRGLSDQDALGRAESQSLKRRGRIDGLEVWEAYVAIRQPVPAEGEGDYQEFRVWPERLNLFMPLPG
jgi:hypothetical protein